MDRQQLRNLVFDKTGVKLDVDDPIFALVALNEAVLAEAVERHVERIDAASRDLAEQARRTGGLPPAVANAEPTAPARTAPLPATSVPAIAAPRQPLALAAGAAVLGAALVLVGQALFFRPAPAAAPITVPAPLSASQIEAIATGEKFARALPRLDARTRNAVLAEMQKP